MKRDQVMCHMRLRLQAVLCICIGFLQGLAAQALEAEYDFLLDLGLVQQYRATLFIGTNRAYFKWGTGEIVQPEGDAREFHLSYQSADSTGQFNYTDLDSGLQFSPVADLNGSTRILREPAMAVHWNISGETRQIGPYSCFRAETRFRGRDYQAWFTPEIPTRFGPWKLHGLPGLIVQVSEMESRAVIRLRRLREAGHFPEFDTKVPEYIDLAGYRELLSQRGQDLIRRIQSKMPRGAFVEITGRQDLEQFEQ